jgi:hypothetical protein
MISDASPVLYVASENRAYFQSVHILIPAEWDHDKASPSTWETFNVRKTKLPHFRHFHPNVDLFFLVLLHIVTDGNLDG